MQPPTNFPDIKRSYETFVHKKVSQKSDCIMAIPQGKRCFAWFNEEGESYLMSLSRYKKGEKQIFIDIRKIECGFITSETILYGTTFYFQNKLFFAAEDILQYKGKSLENFKNIDKMNALFDIFNSSYKVQDKQNIVLGLPIIKKNMEDFENVPYKISHYQCIVYSNNNKVNYINSDFTETPEIIKNSIVKPIINNSSYKKREKMEVFNVSPDIQNDVYYLRNDSNSEELFAGIPDYKTSIMMNNIFRNIKENKNLDELEESDSEEEFENEKIDKFVYLDKCVRMLCEYNYKFKKWVPIKIQT